MGQRDIYTAGHQHRMTDIAVALGRLLNLPAENLEWLRNAASMPDIGKIGVPAEILNKPERLSPTESLLIRAHPEVACGILDELNLPPELLDTIRRHHEWLDGSGYPFGLAGEEIRWEARIPAVADVFDAMRTHRPYRPAPPTGEVEGEFRSGYGSRYDVRVVEGLFAWWKGEGGGYRPLPQG